MRGKLLRIDKAVDGVFGVLTLNNKVICVTLERPWQDNKPNLSCIPPDVYQCKRVDSPKYKDTFEVLNVPGRTHILFHSGNRIKDSKGCILLGSEYGELQDERAVLESSKSFIRFMTMLEGIEFFPLQIINL
jgi:hypothetical protein